MRLECCSERFAVDEAPVGQMTVEQPCGDEGLAFSDKAEGVMSGLALLLPVPDGGREIGLKRFAGESSSLAALQQMINGNP